MKIISTPQKHTKASSLGFTLVELCAMLVIMVVLVGAITPSLAQIRSAARDASSTANLMQIGQARDQYATDNKDRIYTYTWRAGEAYTLPDGTTRVESSDIAAASRQNQEIIMRRTGRISGSLKIRNISSILVHRRNTHIVLLDYMAGDNDEFFSGNVFVDPDNGDMLNWHEHPSVYGSTSGIPYVIGPTENGYDKYFAGSSSAMRQRWAFASSYFSTTFAWQSDGPANVWGPLDISTNRYIAHGNPNLSGRFMNEVLFPSKKVHLFEEYDREQRRQPYFAYDHAKPEKLMFDGAVNTQSSGEAESAYDPNDPNGDHWTQPHRPIDVFPIPLDGLGSNVELNMRYMWTKHGLQGVDYNTQP